MAISTQTLQAAWETFLNDYYKEQIEEAALNYPDTKSLVIDYQHIDLRDPSLAENLLDHPLLSLTAAEDAIKLIEVPVEPRPHLHVRVKNLPKINHILIRKLRAEHLGKFVAVDGIIKKVVEVRPKLTDASFLCRRCGAVFRVPQEENVLAEPEVCPEEQGGCGQASSFKLLTEESRFIDSQKVEIQENPEGLRGGSQPERLTVYLEDDLVGHIAPGDRIVLNGVFRAQQRRQGSLKLAEFMKVMDCNTIEVQQLDFEEVEILPEDEEKIRELASRDDIYTVLRDSFAPEILGMEDIKDAMILSLFSGVAKEYQDGTRLRGDIHLLLVGDPGLAKCVRGDTVVPLATGDRPLIRDMVEEAMEGERSEVDDGWWAPLRVPVFTMDARGRMRTKYTSRAWKRTAPDEMIRIRTRSGREIEVTPTHPLFMTDGVAIHPRAAGKLKEGDFVAVPRRYPIVGGQRPHTDEPAATVAAEKIPVHPSFLRDVRVGLGLSQSQMGIAPATVEAMECGREAITRQSFAAISERLVEVAHLRRRTVDSGYVAAAAKMATLSTADLRWDRIESIEGVAPSEPFVYDLEVPETHNFVANGIVNHNSQLLRYLSKLSPRAVYTSGKGASSAGLTASAVRDEFSEGQWSLEAGALVLADQGVALIDELDKMDEKDSSAMHQAMEQQEISISKAGINATLKSRCAVVAAANPKLGRFDEYTPISQQIDLPLPLITRFDLIFAIRDIPDRSMDDKLAEHVLMTHRAGQVHEYRKKYPENGWSADAESKLFVRLDPAVDGQMMRKYIAYARRNVFPVLDEDAVERVREFYVDLRNSSDTGAIPFTPRALEAIVRIAEASARARLSQTATMVDAQRAINIFMNYIRGVGTDSETGALDFDVLATGASHSQQERMRRILEIIRTLASEDDYGTAAEADIVREAAAAGIDEQRIRAALDSLKQRGQIYSPKNGRFAPV